MFRNLPVYAPSEASLVKLGKSMIQDIEDGELDKPLGEEDDDENTAQLDGQLRLPAGYTYFGQFVDHDITFDPVSSLMRQDDPDALVDYRTPRFDLDNLYGRGPSDQPYLYQPDGLHLTLGKPVSQDPRTAGPDLQRVETGRAIIGDPRNDENLIVSQLQSTVLRFHNTVLDQVGAANPNLGKEDVFKLTQQTVRWHYQWVVIHDFLRRLVGQEVIDDILQPAPYTAPGGSTVNLAAPRLRFYHWHKQPYMPIEFSVAAYRYGHSVVRPSYLINDVAKTDPPVQGASRIPLFSQTGQEKQSLDGFRPLPPDWGVQWKFFLPGINGSDPTGADHLPQPSYKLDAVLSHPLGALTEVTAGPDLQVAGFDPSIAQVLAVRNLIRGLRMGLPSGQDVARAMGIEPLSDEELLGGMTLDEETKKDLEGHAPLWFYVLKEAEKRAESAHLGPVGGRIVAEVLVGLLAADPLSYLSVQPNWQPTLPAATAGTFTLSDLVNIAIPAPDTPVPPVYTGGS
jgi:Animal haem peroxidase